MAIVGCSALRFQSPSSVLSTPTAQGTYVISYNVVVGKSFLKPITKMSASFTCKTKAISIGSRSDSVLSNVPVNDSVPFQASRYFNLSVSQSPRRANSEFDQSPVRYCSKIITIQSCHTLASPRTSNLSSSKHILPSSFSASKRGSNRTNWEIVNPRSRAVESLEILVNPESDNKKLLSQISLLKEPYICPFYLKNCHVETIFASYFRSLPKSKYKRECLRMADNGTVSLDWPVAGEDEDLWRTPLAQDAPLLILLPGLTGGSGDTYVRHMLIRARKAGWRVVVFNSRGCGDSPVTSPQFYSASFTEDLRQVVKYVGSRYQNSRTYAAGWSLGANILVRYLGQEGENCPLTGAVSLCNPFELVLADENFHKGFNNIYDKHLAGALGKIFAKHASLFEEIGGDFNIPLAENAKTVRDFDDGITRVSFGFKTVDDYYFQSSSSHSIKDVRIPLLCIQAEDDPIAPSAGIPRADIEANLNCALIVTPRGGHLGWIAGSETPFGAPWTDPLVIDYLVLLDTSVESGTAFERSKGESGDVQLMGVETRESKNGGLASVSEPITR